MTAWFSRIALHALSSPAASAVGTVFMWIGIGIVALILLIFLWRHGILQAIIGALLQYALWMGGLTLVAWLVTTIYKAVGLGWSIALGVLVLIIIGIVLLANWSANQTREMEFRRQYRISCPFCQSDSVSLNFKTKMAKCNDCGQTMRF